jgi:NADP-dependent 3-hydroxy acid dehydrogenase YdfG
MPVFNIKNSVAFVTGTNKPNGIGRAVVDALLEGGAAKVYATARDASQLDDLVAAPTSHGKVVAVSLDVTDLNAMAALGESFPDVTLVVNNAGYAGFQDAMEDVDVAVAEVMINCIAPLAIGKSFAPVFAKLEVADKQLYQLSRRRVVFRLQSGRSLVDAGSAS